MREQPSISLCDHVVQLQQSLFEQMSYWPTSRSRRRYRDSSRGHAASTEVIFTRTRHPNSFVPIFEHNEKSNLVDATVAEAAIRDCAEALL
jgi:hypothetical protein